MHRGVQGEFSFVSNGVEVGRVTADGIALPLFTAGSVLFAGAGGTISEDTGLTYASATDLLTVVGGVITAAVGPTSTQQHTLPVVASDTVALLAATQILTNKTLNLTSNTLVATSLQVLTAVTDETGTGALTFATSPTLVTPLLGTPTSGVLTNCTGLPISTGVSGLATGIATWLATPSSANLITAITDETGSGALVFGTSPAISGPTLSGSVVGTYTIAGTPTVGANLLFTDNTFDIGASGATRPRNLFLAGDATIGDQLLVSGVGPHVIGGATSPAIQVFVTGTFSPGTGTPVSLQFSPTLTGVVNNDSYGVLISPTLTEAASGTHTDFISLVVNAPTITAGSAALTNASSVKINSAPTAATNNYALWVDSGAVRLDSSLWVEATPTEGTAGEQLTSGGAATVMDWTAAACVAESKQDVRRWTNPEMALAAVLDTPIYSFRYKNKQAEVKRPITTGDFITEYVGPMAHEAPWVMHHEGRILNPINAFGYLTLAIQALSARLDRLGV